MRLTELIASWPGALLLQESGTAYLLVNALHILGVGLLVGAILPLDLRLLGLFRGVPLEALGPFLARAAAVGGVLAGVTGLWLFSVRPADYLVNPAFLAKAALLALAFLNVALLHRGGRFARAVAARAAPLPFAVRLGALCSAVLWLSVLLAGRWIGFV